ncbi:MAG: outer membrane protein assembly factor BamB family protein, partial [Planctomycetota bacterium]
REAYTVHGLERDAAKVRKAREHIANLGLYGDVSVEHFDSDRLPYAENLVSQIVVEDQGAVTDAELMRALAPGGVLLVREGGRWSKRVKPYPESMDEWTHFLHDASNNAVASDAEVGQPRRLRWVAGPLWLRSHEIPSGIQNVVTGRGRIFYFFDEGLIGITDQRMPSKYSIVARDAFNGRFLWKRNLSPWGWRQWASKNYGGKNWTTTRAFRTQVPGQNQRRMVVDGDRLLVTLGYDAPLSILDAATGERRTTVDDTKGMSELVVDDGVAVGFVRPEEKLVAVSAKDGEVLWRAPAAGYRGMTLAAEGGRVYLVTQEGLLGLDLKSGKRLWRVKAGGRGARTLVVAEGVVLTLGGKLEGHDARSGEKLWDVKSVRSAYGVDLFVAQGLVWQGVQIRGENAKAVGLDPRTGKPKRTIDVKKLISPEHHHRCYRNKATERFVILSYEGAEFVDLVGDEHGQNNFLRGACKYGMTPANGLLYVPADQCFCQPGAKMLGFTAVGPAAKEPVPPVADDARLVKGPAYGKASASGAAAAFAGEDDSWPTFRHDAARHGSTKGTVTGAGAVAWKADLGGRLTPPVAAGGRVYVAAVDRHTLLALDAKTGERLWTFVAGSRIDSPPTVHGDLVLFGSRDGRVHCLRATDGAEVWRFLAAPHDRRVGAFGQIESAWPVYGSVLVRDGVAYVGAGRSTYLDGGVYLYALDPATGKILHRGRTSGPHVEVGKERLKAFFIPGANADVLVSEGDHIYMRQLKFTPELEEVDIPVLSSKGEKDAGLHVFSTAGLLDGSWYNRTFWMYSKRWPGFQLANQAPKAGQLLVVDDETTYALRAFYRRNVHSPMFLPGKEGYLLFADRNSNEPQIVGDKGARKPIEWLPQSDYARGRGKQVRKLDSQAFGLDKMIGYTRVEPPIWQTWVKVRVRALVKAGDRLWAAGPPDMYEEADPHASFEGRRGAVLISVSAVDGKVLSETKLASPPVFDGMIAASGRLYVSLEEGSLVCMGP